MSTQSRKWDNHSKRRGETTRDRVNEKPHRRRAYQVSHEPTDEESINMRFEKMEMAIKKRFEKLDLMLQEKEKNNPPSSQVNSVVFSPLCVNCGSLGHRTEDFYHVFTNPKLVEVQ